MNFVMWMSAGALLGWIGYEYVGMNESRGRMVSACIGAMGGFIGGKLIAPLFLSAAAVAGDFSASTLFFAAAVAAAFLAAGNFIESRWGV